MFQGASSLSLDAKGRLSVPTRHRDVLGATANNQLTITRHPHGCLMIFPRPEWEKFRDRIGAILTGPGGATVAIFAAALMMPLLVLWGLIDKYFGKRGRQPRR